LPAGAVVLPVQTMGELFNVLVRKAGRRPARARAAVLSWRDGGSRVQRASVGGSPGRIYVAGRHCDQPVCAGSPSIGGITHGARRVIHRCGRRGHRPGPMSEMAAIGPSGRTPWIAGSPEHSLGSPFKIQGKNQCVLEPLHHPCGKPANLAFKTHSWQRS